MRNPSVAELRQNPGRYHDRTVRIEGRVTDAWGLPLSAHTAPALHLPVCCAAPRLRNIEWFYDHARIEAMVFDGAVRDPETDAVPGRDDAVAAAFDAWFAGADHELDLTPDLGTVASPFRRRVLETLRREVPWGETVTYGELAAMAGKPGAALFCEAAVRPLPVTVT